MFYNVLICFYYVILTEQSEWKNLLDLSATLKVTGFWVKRHACHSDRAKRVEESLLVFYAPVGARFHENYRVIPGVSPT